MVAFMLLAVWWLVLFCCGVFCFFFWGGGCIYFCWHGFSSLQNQASSMMKQTFLSWWEWPLPAWPRPHPQGARAHSSLTMISMEFRSGVLRQRQRSRPPSSSNTNWGNIVRKNVVHHSCKIPKICPGPTQNSNGINSASLLSTCCWRRVCLLAYS